MTTASANGAPGITGTGSPRSEPRSEVLETGLNGPDRSRVRILSSSPPAHGQPARTPELSPPKWCTSPR